MNDEAANVGARTRRAVVVWLAVIAAAAVLPYVPSLSGGFVLDDVHLILINPLAHSLSKLPETFTTDYLRTCPGADAVYYRPLVAVSYQLTYALAGPNPLPFRLTNLALSLLAAILVFAFARRVTGSVLAAGAAGVAFAVLPSHAESVAWISGRTDILATIFMLGALLVFTSALDSERPPGAGRAVSFSVLLGCALFSKETALTLPLLMAAYVWVFSKRPAARQIATWAAAIAVPIALYLVLRRHALGIALDSQTGFMLGDRLLRAGIVYTIYLRMLFVPMELRLVYDHYPLGMPFSPVQLAAWLAPAGTAAFAIWIRARWAVVSFGLLWVLIGLLPASDVLPVHGLVPVERFVYLASVGSSLVVGWVLWRLYEWHPRGIGVRPGVLLLAAVGCALYCAALTLGGSQVYTTNLAWAERIAADKPRYKPFRMNAGKYFADAGRIDRAVPEYEAAVQIGWQSLTQTERAVLEYRLGILYGALGDMRGAVRTFTRAVEARPDFGTAWRNLGRANLRMGSYAASVEAYERASALMSLSARDRRELALARRKAGRPPTAGPSIPTRRTTR